jgi:signal transduction histidine kinase/CheY-like chemotaxis protein
MDLSKENNRLKLRIKELETRLEELNSPLSHAPSTGAEIPAVSYKTRFELLTNVQSLCKSGYLILSLQKEFIECSANIWELLGFPEANTDLTYTRYLSSIIPGDRQRVGEIIRKHLALKNETSTTEFKVKGKDRSVHYIIQHCRVFHESTSIGKNLVFILLRNITEQRQMEKKIGYSENKFHRIFSSTPLGMILYTIDAKGELLVSDLNPAARQMLKVQDDSLTGKPIEIAFPGLAKTTIPEEFKKVACDGVAWHGSNIEYDNDGQHNIVDISAFQTSLGTTAVIFQNISERKQAEEEIRAYSKKLKEQNEILRIINDELIRSKEKAEESDKLKSSFLANMSHEIRTPMNAILGFANLLKNTNFSDERKLTFIDIINSKSKQLLQIITDIIDISKIEAGQISIFNKSFPLNRMVQELYLSFDNLRKQDNKPVILNYSVGLPDGEDGIFSDKIRIEQILSNFLSNAYKFTDTGNIEIGYRIENASITFFVKDTGIGITPGEQKVIFDRFRQVESSHSRSYSGTGLGLAISKGLAERMNGQIYVESDFGKGSVFYLTLPYFKQPSVTPAEKAFNESVFDWSDKTILIAEDEEDNFTFLEVLLKVTGARIIWAKNGLEAVSLCRKNSDIDLVLMDIKLPVLDGMEATLQIKNIRPTLPVIVQTAYAMAADEEQCLKCGCDAYLSKPIKIEPLFRLIKEYI